MSAPTSGQRPGNLDEANEEVDLLFHVLSQHKNHDILRAVTKGKAALVNNDTDQVRESLRSIQDILKDWEVHPALAHQLNVATTAVQVAAEPTSKAPEANVSDQSNVARRSPTSFPSL
jgi:hypothetical protein